MRIKGLLKTGDTRTVSDYLQFQVIIFTGNIFNQRENMAFIHNPLVAYTRISGSIFLVRVINC